MYKRVLTVQDISCFGQCSLTVALPIISACGHETVILPSAVLSTHTAGFTGFTVRDLADDIPGISKHWQKEGIDFDAIYTGYLGSIPQIDMVLELINGTLKKNGIKIIDPAMADNGKLYPAFDMNYANAMKKLAKQADYLLPNITEGALLADMEYKEKYDESYIYEMCERLSALGAKTIILTGVSYNAKYTGIVVFKDGDLEYYKHVKLKNSRHGTGDIYSSAFAGALLSGKNAYESAVIAADYTVECLKETVKGKAHLYGAKFEPVLPELIEMINA